MRRVSAAVSLSLALFKKINLLSEFALQASWFLKFWRNLKLEKFSLTFPMKCWEIRQLVRFFWK